MIILLLFAFLAGFITILAPCIWPLLPIVLSASSGQGQRRPLGITLGVMTSFTIFTLSISYLEKLFHFDANVFRLFAVIVIAFFGFMMIVPAWGTAFENAINRILSPFQNKLQKQGAGFGAGYATGFSIGLVWAPCAGPILATIATLAATQAVDIKVIMVTLAYVTGLGIPLFIFAMVGSKVFSKMRQVNRYTGIIQKIFGLIMIMAALLIYTNYDKTIQVKILEIFPSYGNFLNTIENNDVVAKELSALRGDTHVGKPAAYLSDLGEAPDFTGITEWLNSNALTIESLRGKVVLIDFWTYSCINCVRTLPHVTRWYETYKSKNFVVIGVHTPEFAFEKNVNNVKNALQQFKINYPVALDNDYGTWKAYKNRFWPAKYLIDAKGRLRYSHFGEGSYQETENAIRALIKESGNALDINPVATVDLTPQHKRTLETYLGSQRIERLVSYEDFTGEPQIFTRPKDLARDTFAYEGTWDVRPQYAKAFKGSNLEFNFTASKVFLVISPGTIGNQIKVTLDGKVVDQSNAGVDVNNGIMTLDQERLYHLIDLKGKVGNHLLRLEFEQDGIAVYAFTFG